jgi:hypothetical protein
VSPSPRQHPKDLDALAGSHPYLRRSANGLPFVIHSLTSAHTREGFP